MIRSFHNEDCTTGARRHIKDGSVDLIVTDPPYGLCEGTKAMAYHRDESHVLDGYVEIPFVEYAEFTSRWMHEAIRVLRPGGSMYVVVGIQSALPVWNAIEGSDDLTLRNHIVWHYNALAPCQTRFTRSHRNIFHCVKPGGEITFNRFCRFGMWERDSWGRSLRQRDLCDVWVVGRERLPANHVKNRNQLPMALLIKMIQYSSNPGDLVCDFFLGGFTTARAAIGLNRGIVGFEKNKIAHDYFAPGTLALKPGYLIPALRKPDTSAKRPNDRLNDYTARGLIRREVSYNAYRPAGKDPKRIVVLNAVLRGEIQPPQNPAGMSREEDGPD